MQRPSLLGTYKNQLKAYLRLKYKVDEAKAEELALEICRKHYRPLTAIIEETKVDNHPIIKGVDLATWFDAQRDNLITPSGSVFMQQEKKLGTIIEMVKKFLAQRSKEKKLMLKAKAAGDKTEQLKHYYAQTLIKIFVNALPGNYGSKYSIFYDKGNYNAITSAGRALIGFAYSEIEAVLGGNFMWLTIDDLKNHILTQIYAGIDEDKVEKVMAKFHLHRVTKDDLYAFYKKELSIYNHYTWYEDEKVNGKTIEHAAYIGHKEGDYAKVAEMVNLLNDTQVQYFYYFENLRHIIMENDAEFRTRFQNMFNYDVIKQDDSVQPDELFKIDGALVNMVNVAFSKYLQSGDSKVQVYDFPSKRPELAKRFINIARHVADGLKDMDDLFDIFIFTKICRPNVQQQPLLYRNSTVVSDTDSTIFTVKDWVEWYTGSVYSIDETAYHIAMLMIYWITKAVGHALVKYSEAGGARGEYTETMLMKNEFLYPVMIQADVKKHYAGVITVQEGVVLPKGDIDIKGGQFRGSSIPKVATEFAEKFISEDILIEGIYKNGRVDGHKLVEKVREFELKIYNDLQEGKTEWYKSLAIKTKDKYTNPMSSPWYYYLAWQHVFAPKYGDMQIPLKTPAVPIAEPTESYWTWLMKQDAALARRWIDFLQGSTDGIKHRWPTYMPVITIKGKVPAELIPLIKTKDIIHHSVKPLHLILRQLPINCGADDDKNLFSEIYPLVRGKKR